MTSRLHHTFAVLLSFLAALSAPGKVAAQDLSEAAIDTIVERTIALVDSHYVFDEKKPAITQQIQAQLDAGRYYTAPGPDSLAAMLTRNLRSVSNDKHLYVEHVEDSEGNNDTGWDAWAEQERVNEKLNNFGFTEAKVLDGNVGYLRIVEFMHPQRGFEAASSAMQFLANTTAMIIDVRGNGGGYGGLMDLILSYYFEPAPTHISTTHTSSESEPPSKSYTLAFVPVERRVGELLYVLIDGETGSAAEFFAYTLQTFEKATLVGESSVGAANMNSYYDINDRFRISVSTGAPVNPVTNTNWEGAGVQPDVTVLANEAPRTAHRLVLQALLEEVTDSTHRKRLEEALQEVSQEQEE